MRKLTPLVRVSPQEGEHRAVLLQGCKQRYAPSGSHARKLPDYEGPFRHARKHEKGVFCLLLYLSGRSDQFPPNIQYFTGSTPDCQSFFRHLRRFFPGNFVKFSRKRSRGKNRPQLPRRASGNPSVSLRSTAPLSGEAGENGLPRLLAEPRNDVRRRRSPRLEAQRSGFQSERKKNAVGRCRAACGAA